MLKRPHTLPSIFTDYRDSHETIGQKVGICWFSSKTMGEHLESLEVESDILQLQLHSIGIRPEFEKLVRGMSHRFLLILPFPPSNEVQANSTHKPWTNRKRPPLGLKIPPSSSRTVLSHLLQRMTMRWPPQGLVRTS
jgi:hypothetical protein